MKGKNCFYAKYVKRLLDIICSALFLLIFSWFYVIIAILVRIKLGSPVIFKQPRPGKNGETFYLCKFRSMTNARDAEGNLLPDDDRLTSFGRFLRSSSCDELPEIWLILTGKMSLIGPRPLLMEYLPYYTEEEAHRHDMLPGLTGWAQVNGRNTLTWEEKFAYDLEYIEKCSFMLDVKILWLTFMKVVKRSDILIGKEFKVGKLNIVRKNFLNATDVKVTIREFCETDVADKVKWVNDSRNNQYLHYELPLDETKTLQWFKNKKNNRYDGVIEYNSIPVGLIGLLQISQNKAEFYIMLGCPEYKGKGIARQATELLKKYAKEKLGLKELYLYTETENISAQHLFERVGFIKQFVEKDSACNKGKSVDRFYYSLSL